ncbi:META domain-containing protein [Methylobacterium sp. NEAU 140]|uniref:META domain-containing protein n=1 Tax=Methylobacterium sp. NEAU 140 TaxID=3064945 RepID=UPI0027371938|nr:META domain-containing protein [Methylobacterium sp. NEAU 140]MDP4021448.1 META domain-containing protein [Methylobacterium sp. NEAU 140]
MRAVLIATLACAVMAVDVAAVSQAQAQLSGGMTGFGRGNRRPGGEEEKKPQYVPQAKASEKIFPLDSTWTAVSLNGKPFAGGDRPSFIIDKQYRARGYGGCNTFAATAFPLKEQHIAVGPLALTKKACDKGLAATEQAFFIALRTAAVWDMVGSQLVLKSPNGELKFDRAL